MALLVVFVVTRAGGAWLADDPDRYRSGPITVTGDVDRYQDLARAVVHEGAAPYDAVAIEYPPGALPFMWAPLAVADDGYRSAFIGLMVVLDAAGLAGVVVMTRRAGSWWGPWLWALLVPALGPIVYCRLDMAPAVATIWAFERAQAKRWFGAGALLGFGAVTKLYPAVLLLVALAGRWRSRLVAGALAAVVVCVLPFAAVLGGMWDSVVGYHGERGLQVESTGSAVLLAAGHLDRSVQVVLDHGAFHTRAAGAGLLVTASTLSALAVVLAAAWLSRKRARQGEFADSVVIPFATIALLLAVGPVFSPQYMLWLTALGAVAAGAAGPSLRWPLALLALANLITQSIFPFHYTGLLSNQAGPLALLVLRNLCVAAVGALVFSTVAGRTPGPLDTGGRSRRGAGRARRPGLRGRSRGRD